MGLTCNVRLTPDSTCSYMCAVCDAFSFFSFQLNAIYTSALGLWPHSLDFSTLSTVKLNYLHVISLFPLGQRLLFITLWTLSLSWMHSAHGIYMHIENPGYLYLSQRVYLLSWGLKNRTVLFFYVTALFYFIWWLFSSVLLYNWLNVVKC